MSRRRRPGARLRQQTKQRRHEILKQHWWRLLIGAAAYLGAGASAALVMGWIYGREWGFALAGAVVGAGVMFVVFIFRTADPIGARLYRGLEGEQWGHSEIRKLRRSGWRCIPNLYLRAGDVDLVAVGPGGVIVIESKSSEADWAFIQKTGRAEKWANQAHQSAFRVRHLIKQHSGLDAATHPYLVLWVTGAPEGPELVEKGVTAINGWLLRKHLRALPVVLEPDHVDAIADSLHSYATQLDATAGL